MIPKWSLLPSSALRSDAPEFGRILDFQSKDGGDYSTGGGSYSPVHPDISMPVEMYKATQERASNRIMETLNKVEIPHQTIALDRKLLKDIFGSSTIATTSPQEVGATYLKDIFGPFAIATTGPREVEATYTEVLSYHKENFSQEGLFESQNQEDSKHVSGGAQIAIAKLFSNLMNDWELLKKDMATLLGLDFDTSGQEYVKNLLNGTCSFSGRDTRYRMAQLIQIREILFALFKDHGVENKWLREKQSMLNDKTPMDLLLEGPMKNLVLVREFVETVAGR